MFDDITLYVTSFERDVQQWERRFRQDKNDRIFTHYVLMSQQLREKARLFLNPTIAELQKLQEAYGLKYTHKDLPYHLTNAVQTCTFLKNLLKELIDLYEKQAPYEHLAIRWDYNLASLKKRLLDLHARLAVIQKIIATEPAEHENL